MSIAGDIDLQDVVYNFTVSINKSNLGLPFNVFDDVQHITNPFSDKSVLLIGVLAEISHQILGKDKKQSSFTENWDAFKNFYNGELAWRKLDIPNAKLFYEKSLDIDPGFILAKLRLAGAFYFEGSFLAAKNLVNSIRPSLNLLSKIDSLRAEALSARVADKYKREIQILKEIYSEFPSQRTAYEVAEAYYQRSDIESAIEYYKKALNLDENYSLAHNHLAYCYSHQGMHQQALKHFHLYLELDSTANAYDSIGDGYMAAGLLDSAQLSLENAIKFDPKLFYVYRNLFELRIRQGKFNEAISAADKYIYYTYSPDTKATGLFFKGMVKYCKNELESAKQFCERALQTYDAGRCVFAGIMSCTGYWR